MKKRKELVAHTVLEFKAVRPEKNTYEDFSNRDKLLLKLHP